MLKKIIPVSSMEVKRGISYLFMFFCAWVPLVSANDSLLLVDKVIASVDQQLILHSELEEGCKQLALEGKLVDESVKLNLLRELVLNKIFIAKALLDDIQAPKAHIQRECDYTIASWVQRIGSEEKLSQYFHQPIYNIKKDLKRRLKEKYLVWLVNQNITQQVVVSPAEVKAYFDGFPLNKRPYYPASVAVSQLVVYPKIAKAREEETKNKLLRFKKLLIACSVTFSELAKKHSEDPSSALKGGEIGWVPLGALDPAYEAAALALKVGEISDPVRSAFGFHLIELIGRNKDQYNTRHILQLIEPTKEEIELAEVELKQIKEEITSGTLTFEAAIKQYSEDQETRSKGGLITDSNQAEGIIPGVILSNEELDPEVYFAVDGLQEGGISEPQFMGIQHQSGWRLLYLKQKVEAHEMNLTQDYEKIHHILMRRKKEEAVYKWIQAAQSEYVISFAPEYKAVEALLMRAINNVEG